MRIEPTVYMQLGGSDLHLLPCYLYYQVVPTSFGFISGDIGEAYLYSVNNRVNVRHGVTPRAVFTFDVSALRLKVGPFYCSLLFTRSQGGATYCVVAAARL